jgi:hypothetical protein
MGHLQSARFLNICNAMRAREDFAATERKIGIQQEEKIRLLAATLL